MKKSGTSFPVNTILSFDPGETTGYAFVGREGEVIETGTLAPEYVGGFLRSKPVWSKNFRVNEFNLVVMEDTPTPTLSRLNIHMRFVISTIISTFPRIERIPPGVWKSSRIYNRVVDFPYQTPHEIDAVLLGRYYAAKRFRDTLS